MKINSTNLVKLYKKSSDKTKSIFEVIHTKEHFLPKIYDKVKDLKSLCKYLKIKESELLVFKKPKDKFERYINSCAIIHKIVEVYNQGTILNFKNTNQYKYCPYKYFSGGRFVVDSDSWHCYFDCSGGFYYKSNELSLKGYENFKEIYDDYFSLE
jgi:hypothetical protein